MDLATVFEIKTRIEMALSNTKEAKDFKKDFECSTHGEYVAYLKGQHDTLEATLGHLQSFIEGKLYAAENQTIE